MKLAARVVLLGLALVLPWQLGSVWAFVGAQAAAYTIAALSLVVLTGYAGQISLAQGAFLGVGAFAVGILSTKLGLPLWAAIPLAALCSLPVSLVIGLPSLRLRGFQLAIATLGFAVAAERWLFGWVMGKLVGQGSAGSDALRVGIPRPRPFGLDLRADFPYYVFTLALTGACVWLVSNLGRGRSGRALFAVREGEVAASTLGINVAARKVTAFALSGVLAALAGAVLGMTLYNAHGTSYHFFLSITIFSVAVLGGVRSVWGAVLGGLFFAAAPELLGRIPGLGGPGIVDLVAGAGLVAFMVSEPEGIAGALGRLRRRGAVPPAGEAAVPVRLGRVGAPDPDSAPALETRGLTMRFGGVTALQDVSLRVPPGTIFGLIGPNGAGKTTLFNCVCGLVRPQGEVLFEGRRLDGLPPHSRARLGIGRTYQTPKLFGHLTVEENLLVGMTAVLRATLAEDLLRAPRARSEEAAARGRARAVLELLDMQELAHTRVSDLPLGHMKLTELARALVALPRLLLVDEPAGGLDAEETARLAGHLVRVRDELGITVVLIEHDMDLVMPLCDAVAVLDFGRLIAVGPPARVRTDPAVVAAYLGEEPVGAVP